MLFNVVLFCTIDIEPYIFIICVIISKILQHIFWCSINGLFRVRFKALVADTMSIATATVSQGCSLQIHSKYNQLIYYWAILLFVSQVGFNVRWHVYNPRHIGFQATAATARVYITHNPLVFSRASNDGLLFMLKQVLRKLRYPCSLLRTYIVCSWLLQQS